MSKTTPHVDRSRRTHRLSMATVQARDAWSASSLAVLAGLFGCVLLMLALLLSSTGGSAFAAPIPPPEGAPKLSQSTMTVSPKLVNTGGETLTYVVEIRNTGAYTASNVSFSNTLPVSVTYSGGATASAGSVTYQGGVLSWSGPVGFDAAVIISYSVQVTDTFEGALENMATLTNVTTGEVVTVSAEAMVTDDPIFVIEKTSTPDLPGPNKPLTYTLSVTNVGQPAVGTILTVRDTIPANTTFRSAGADGSKQGNQVVWNRQVVLNTGQSTSFTFSVNVGDVADGTVITNDTYQVEATSGISAGEPYTTTVVDPRLSIYKTVEPDPPGSNRDMVYNLTVLNTGSLATGLVITDVVPSGVTYVSGGTNTNGTVKWTLPRLDTNATATVSFTVSITDVAEVDVANERFGVCSAEGICAAGNVLTSTVKGPGFVLTALIDPMTKKPGGGNSPVTPTLVIENEGPGDALDARAYIQFDRISVSGTDLTSTAGSLTGPFDCGTNCDGFYWTGDVAVGEVITITTTEGQSTIGGSEGTEYVATITISDTLGDFTTEPVTATAVGLVTHLANLQPYKYGPAVVGAGQLITYTIDVHNTGQSHDATPVPTLTDTLPLSTTFVSASDGGTLKTVGGKQVVSWNLPALSTGDLLRRTFTVRVAEDVVTGTQILNDDYAAAWTNDATRMFNYGEPVTTTVREVGLIDSFKTVTPTLSLPGPDNVLTYTVHVVNTSAVPLSGVKVYDILPWRNSTYQRDAIATAGTVISDIVSVSWTGDVAAFSEELITMTVKVDPFFEGVISNTATITHTSLREPVVVEAIAYVTDDPVLQISKTATPSPFRPNVGDNELTYEITVVNLGQQATSLVITDVVPLGTQYVLNSATNGGLLVDDTVTWQHPVLKPGEQATFSFTVKVVSGVEIVNEHYGVTSGEGAWAVGDPVITRIFPGRIYLPLVSR